MSAFFGFRYRDARPADSADLVRMSASLRHRGSSEGGRGIWSGRSTGLGQLTFPTTPESLHESGPLVRQGGVLVLVADARIDNREELIAGLDVRGPKEGITDGDLILRAYQKWGRSSPEKLLGDFAFAIWDAERQVMFCARDPMGVKPFYYHISDRLFVFASEIKALLCLREVPRELDEVQVAFFLDWFRSDHERTFYKDILRLPSSHWLEVDDKQVRTGVYWRADPQREVTFATDDQYVEAFRELFMESVRCRLRSPFPVGSALSGGLDSSSVVCTARLLLDEQEPFHAVSAGFPGLPEVYRKVNDESQYIDAVARMDGIVSHRIRADELSVFGYLDKMFWYHDVPPFGFMYWMRWAVYQEAHEHGVRVFFSGDDGDSVVSYGYERFNDLARAGEWETAIKELEALGRRWDTPPVDFSNAYLSPRITALARARRWKLWHEGSRKIARHFDQSAIQFMTRSLMNAYVPQGLVDLKHKVRGGKSPQSLVSPTFARRVDLEERKREILRADTSRPDLTARESHAQVLPSPMLQHIMEVTDSMGSAFSIETRCPFLDRRLIEFSLAIPVAQKLGDGWTRLILRKAMDGILPPEVQTRLYKADLGYNFILSLRDRDRQVLKESLFDEPDVLAEYVDMNELRETHSFFESHVNKGVRKNAGRLYIAAVLARWLRGWHEGSRPESESSPA